MANWRRHLLTSCILLLVAACRRPPAEIDGLLKSNRLSAFVFLAADCPLSQSYTLTLNRLHAEFSNRSIGFYGVFAGGSGKDAAEFAARYSLNFPTLADAGFRIADFLKATKTPEVFVLDPGSRVIYEGAIDNGAPALGEHREVITEHYLRDALERFTENKTVPVKRTEAVGCFIERKS